MFATFKTNWPTNAQRKHRSMTLMCASVKSCQGGGEGQAFNRCALAPVVCVNVSHPHQHVSVVYIAAIHVTTLV